MIDTYATRTKSLNTPSRILLIILEGMNRSTLSRAIAGNMKNIPMPIIKDIIIVPTNAKLDMVLSVGSALSDASRDD